MVAFGWIGGGWSVGRLVVVLSLPLTRCAWTVVCVYACVVLCECACMWTLLGFRHCRRPFDAAWVFLSSRVSEYCWMGLWWGGFGWALALVLGLALVGLGALALAGLLTAQTHK